MSKVSVLDIVKMKCFTSLKRNIFCFQIFILLLFYGLLQSCSETANVQIRLPANELYQKAMVAVEDEFYQEALKNFEILVD
jgi:outer membrane protein assembly factor BamD (BamD/ComL family)